MRSLAAALALGVFMIAGAGTAWRASASEPPPDAELLEFLGTVDTAENGLKEYLERTDVEKIAANRAPAAVQGGASQSAVSQPTAAQSGAAQSAASQSAAAKSAAASRAAAEARPAPVTSAPASSSGTSP